MIKNIVKLEHIVADKAYHFMCDPDSPIPAIKDALFQFMAYVAQIEAAQKAQLDAQKQAEAQVPAVVEPLVQPAVEESKPA